MARTVKAVVKVIAPLALEALAKEAEKLLDDSNVISFKEVKAVSGAEADGEIVTKDTHSYINDKFAENFRYYYKGAGSTPPYAKFPLVGATEDIIVWNPNKNEQSDINKYLNSVLSDTLPDSDAIEVAQNLTDLFQARFSEIELSWTPFIKRYNLKESGITIDLQMVTAAGYDSGKNPIGIASYCFVAYNT